MKLAFKEGLKLGRNYPCKLTLARMLECMGRGEIIGVSISNKLRDRLDAEHRKNKLCGYPIMEAKDLSKGLVVHYSDGSAIWWDGVGEELEPYWPHHLPPDAFAR